MAISVFQEVLAQQNVDQILAANGFNAIVALTGQSRGSRLDRLYLSNNDTIDHLVQVVFADPSANFSMLGAVNVPHGAGFTSLAVEAVALLVPNGDQCIQLPLNCSVRIQVPVAVTSTFQVGMVAIGGQF
jgi:hypothetical protein